MNIEENFSTQLKKIAKPARYVGGESGIRIKEHRPEMLKVALCFPDMYEIGMSNNALKLIYTYLNNFDNIVCERVFAPAHDFSQLLKENNLPLISLETSTPLKEFDILAFTVGSELLYTNILYVLDLAGIPLDRSKRGATDPVVIAGGPAVTNPAVLSKFLDGIFLGEIEPALESFYKAAADRKSDFSNDKYREFLLKMVEDCEYYWTNRNKKVKKATWQGFSTEEVLSSSKPLVPSMRPVQDHAVVEIMRGCPNGCRFCHAGVFYRQKREKDLELIIKEADNLVHNGGYREITLSSLSTGDFSLIKELSQIMLERYKRYNISLSLPSIKVNSFTLDVLESVSENKKSGLTFAVETAEECAQHSLNKLVDKEDLCAIANTAKQHGWKLIKLYFMIGLPESPENEEESIIEYIEYVAHKTRLRINVNVGTFIPKPHTPYQYAQQLQPDVALEKLLKIKKHFYNANQIKISFHDPYTSHIEGILSRGDEQIGDLIEKVYNRGAYFDAWDEFFQKDIWLDEISKTQINSNISEENAPWSNILFGVSTNFLRNEAEKSKNGELTSICEEECEHLCGVCNKNIKIKNSKRTDDFQKYYIDGEKFVENYDNAKKVIIKYRKQGKASYIGHIDTQSTMEKILVRTGFDFVYTQGFNRKPKIEIVNPLPLGAESKAEYLLVQIISPPDEHEILNRFNNGTIDGIEFYEAKVYAVDEFKTLEKTFVHSDFEVTIDPELLKDDVDIAQIKEIVGVAGNVFSVRIARNGKGVYKIVEMLVKDGHKYDAKVTRIDCEFDF
ncbi:MAG: TIGR03960 family B12-binding radical SAM protein [Spirochaetales bacterium]|nr:TIGR03960 family B12-binding radical SAM protein [Spirochaetales bacterium]